MQPYKDEDSGLLEAWGLVPEDVKTEALNGGWYRESRRVARRLARKHGTSLATAAGVIAALSPRIKWGTNVHGADHVLGGGNTGPGFNTNVEKACRIRDGERPLQVLGGPKVRAFYRAIMGDKDACVIDVWMFRLTGVEPGGILRYRQAEKLVRQAADKVGVLVADFQALTWAQARGGGD